MKILKKVKFIPVFLLIIVMQFIFMPIPEAHAVTPPDRGLGAADSYSVFGKAGVTTTGVTHVWGNAGADSSVGLISSQVDGSIITDGDTAGVATDARSTYDSLMSALQGTPAGVVTGLDLAGTHTVANGNPITPGVYNVGATTMNGDFELYDPSGTGVYIFRSDSSATISTGSSANMILTGACASNVFWAIPASMTIGTGAHIEGTIIAHDGLISLATGATLVGRAISLIAEVTLDANQITQPICAVATPTPTPTSSSVSSSSGPSVCVAPEIQYAPTIVESKRISPTSIFLKWTQADQGLNSYMVQYGLENNKWLYNTIVQGLSTTLNDLPPNQPIWVKVAATANCGVVGDYGETKLVGGPRLPNAGFAPQENNISWYLPVGILVLSSFLLKLIHDGRTESST